MREIIYTIGNNGKPKPTEEKMPSSSRTDLTYLGKDSIPVVAVSTVFTSVSLGKGPNDLPLLWQTILLFNSETPFVKDLIDQIKKKGIIGGKFTSMAAAKTYHHQVVSSIKEQFDLVVI